MGDKRENDFYPQGFWQGGGPGPPPTAGKRSFLFAFFGGWGGPSAKKKFFFPGGPPRFAGACGGPQPPPAQKNGKPKKQPTRGAFTGDQNDRENSGAGEFGGCGGATKKKNKKKPLSAWVFLSRWKNLGPILSEKGGPLGLKTLSPRQGSPQARKKARWLTGPRLLSLRSWGVYRRAYDKPNRPFPLFGAGENGAPPGGGGIGKNQTGATGFGISPQWGKKKKKKISHEKFPGRGGDLSRGGHGTGGEFWRGAGAPGWSIPGGFFFSKKKKKAPKTGGGPGWVPNTKNPVSMGGGACLRGGFFFWPGGPWFVCRGGRGAGRSGEGSQGWWFSSGIAHWSRENPGWGKI